MQQDVFEKLPNLQKRHNKYGIRVSVPDKVRDIIGLRYSCRERPIGENPELLVAAKSEFTLIVLGRGIAISSDARTLVRSKRSNACWRS